MINSMDLSNLKKKINFNLIIENNYIIAYL